MEEIAREIELKLLRDSCLSFLSGAVCLQVVDQAVFYSSRQNHGVIVKVFLLSPAIDEG